jgi:glycerol-3-phosphate dehydrogenase
VLTGWRCIDARRAGSTWAVQLQDAQGRTRECAAAALVNAAGPWAAQFLQDHAHQPPAHALRLVKGSHIVVPRLYAHDHAYIFQNPDRRIIFAIPFEGAFTLIGTTDTEHHGPPGEARVDAQEVDYLCTQVSRYFAKPVTPGDVVWSYAGVRPLLGDGAGDAAAVTRDYQLDLDTAQAPLLTVWGGKITTFRRLAEEAADALCRALGVPAGPWTGRAHLPGGDLAAWIGPARRPDLDFARFEEALARRCPHWPTRLRHRLARCYGSRLSLVMDGAHNLGPEVVPGLHERELHYLRRYEWARCAEDVLWRRTKLGLHLRPEERERVEAWCNHHWPREV